MVFILSRGTYKMAKQLTRDELAAVTIELYEQLKNIKTILENLIAEESDAKIQRFIKQNRNA